MCDGSVAVLPLVGFVPVYFFPAVEQRGLLFQPLLFHEFGHLLYARHKLEMDDLVGELQRVVEDRLLPGSERRDPHARRQAEKRRMIVRAWYRWTQELFCDAVGFQIGGPSFLLAFTTFLSRLDHGDFVRSSEEMTNSHHPVTALRVHFLARRASAVGFSELANRVIDEWEEVRGVLGVTRDYHGFYDDALEDAVERTLADMLTEAAPRCFTDDDLDAAGTTSGWRSPVALCNAAWRVYESDAARYSDWETEQLTSIWGMSST
jgi:hypothetical protein